MKETKNGRVMLEVYMTNGKLMYQEADEEYSRWVCRYSDEPQEDLTSEADWFVNVCDLQRFLSQPDDTIIKPDHLAYTGASYRVSEIQTFVAVATYEGAVALFKRGEDGKFVCSQTYASGINVPQQLWELVYPDARERAIAKVQNLFFMGFRQCSWYFVGKESNDLYAVIPEYAAADGFDIAQYGHSSSYLPASVLDGMEYSQFKLANPEEILALVDENPLIIRGLLNYGFTMSELGLEDLTPKKPQFSALMAYMGRPKSVAHE